ncbi:MAG TPA: hypothetical protein VEG32_00325 [Clostridia bacterium]|nr:hypothetical protein [Clostridia bacterium]
MRSALLLLQVTLVAGAFAQSAPTVSGADVRSLLERIEKLEKRVAELEGRASPGSTPAHTPPAWSPQTAATLPGASAHDAAMHDAMISDAESFPSLKIRGFADVDFSASDRPGARSGFSLGQFVLHLASPLSKKISYFGEVSLTAQPNSYAVDVERSFIRYDVNDTAKISFGRYHTPINYWNTAFHHGSWLQTTVSRPDMSRFGGTFLPVHFVGAQSEGNIPSGGLELGYNVGLGNGRGSFFSRAGDNADANNNRAWLVNVFSRPRMFRHLQIGGSVYNDELTLSPDGPSPEGRNFREWIASGHIVWTGETPEFLAEFANVHHRSTLTGHTFDSQGGYVQVAYRLPVWERRWKPYARYDYIQVPEDDITFGEVEDVRSFTFGLRYDISDFTAFKAEYRNGRGAIDEDRVNSVVMQTAFTF